MDRVKIALLGVGSRGLAYGLYYLHNMDKVEVAGVADPDENKLNFCRQYGITNCYTSWEDFLEEDVMADVLIICTPDYMHVEPAKRAIQKGYNIIIEKPLSPKPEECIELGEIAKDYNKIFLVAHVLRYTAMYQTMKRILDEGKIGELVTVEHSEYVERIHQSHSFVRGNWRRSDETAPMILTKSCHDMDIIAWLVGDRCRSLSSYGSLSYFKESHAPEGAPAYCLDGCPAAETCPYYSVKVYVEDEEMDWWRTISQDESKEARLKALEGSPYGRCVFHCDNDVVDHQVVNMEFDNDVTAVFTMTAFSKGGRHTKLMGTHGEIEGTMGWNGSEQYVKVFNFLTGKEERIEFSATDDAHGGGDFGLMDTVVDMIRNQKIKGETSVEDSVHSHMMAFAAEEARVKGETVAVSDFEARIKNAME